MKKVDNSIKITIIIVAAVLVLALIFSSVFLRVSSTETINAQGTSSVFVEPDLIEVNFNVETKGDSAAIAKDENALIMNDVVNALVNVGFDLIEIETSNFNVYEDFDWTENGRVSKGFVASHAVTLELADDDLDLVGDVVDAGVDNGALLGYINFKLSKELENEYKAIALTKATEDAKTKAEAMANGLGVKLGRVVSIDSNEFGYSPWIAYAERSEDAVAVSGKEIATNIEVGEKEVSGSVSVTYKIK